MSDDLLLAVDGGQTSTTALLSRADGILLGAGEGGPANHIDEPGGLERMRRALASSVLGAFAAAGLPVGTVASACFGMTGGTSVVPGIVAGIVPCTRLRVAHDTVTALAGAGRGEPGVIVIAGSGCAAYGRTADGREAWSSGWGYIMGDEGSAYDIGIQALRAVGRASDGRGPATGLLQAIPAHFNLPDLRAFHAALYSGRLPRPEIAGIARLVGDAAVAGDLVAAEILAAAGRDLGQAAVAVLQALSLLEVGASVYTAGGVFNAGAFVVEPFTARVQQRSPRSRVLPPAFNQVIGALILAFQGLGGAPGEEIFRRIRATMGVLASSKRS